MWYFANDILFHPAYQEENHRYLLDCNDRAWRHQYDILRVGPKYELPYFGSSFDPDNKFINFSILYKLNQIFSGGYRTDDGFGLAFNPFVPERSPDSLKLLFRLLNIIQVHFTTLGQ